MFLCQHYPPQVCKCLTVLIVFSWVFEDIWEVLKSKQTYQHYLRDSCLFVCLCDVRLAHTQQQNERQMEGAPFFACLCLVRNQSWDFKATDFAKVNNHRARNKAGAEVDIMRPSINWPHRIEWPRSEEWSLPLAFNSKLTPNGTRVRAYRAAGGT